MSDRQVGAEPDDNRKVGIPLRPGAEVVLFENVDTDEGGFISGTLFEGTVEQHIPETRKLSFEGNDVGFAEFESLLEEAEGVQVLYP